MPLPHILRGAAHSVQHRQLTFLVNQQNISGSVYVVLHIKSFGKQIFISKRQKKKNRDMYNHTIKAKTLAMCIFFILI